MAKFSELLRPADLADVLFSNGEAGAGFQGTYRGPKVWTQ